MTADASHRGSHYNFAEHLQAFGPHSNRSDMSLADARRYCEQLSQAHYENFPVLSFAVPRRLRSHFAAVYAYCRWSDDLADEIEDGRTSLELLNWWEGELQAMYDGEGHASSLRPRHPVMTALAPTVRRFDIPAGPFRDLLTAFRRDRRQTRYENFDDLLDYCRCSANPVGRLVLYLARVRGPEAFWLSDQICTGLQLANFWQDVAVDWKKGRVYAPAEDLRRFGVTEAQIGSSEASEEFRRMMQFQVERAEQYLRSGVRLARKMPGRLKLVIALFAEGGLAILREIRRQRFDVLSARPRLGKSAFFRILGRSLADCTPFSIHHPITDDFATP